MARELIIEEESGICRGWVHPHNGYYAGDFSASSTATVESTLPTSSQQLQVVPGFAPSSLTSTDARPTAWSSAPPQAA